MSKRMQRKSRGRFRLHSVCGKKQEKAQVREAVQSNPAKDEHRGSYTNEELIRRLENGEKVCMYDCKQAAIEASKLNLTEFEAVKSGLAEILTKDDIPVLKSLDRKRIE